MDILAQLSVHTLIAASVYALIASGLSFIYATTRVFHLAHGGVIALSAYVFYFTWSAWELSLTFAGLLSILSAVVLGLAMNEFVYEPLRARGTKSLGYLIATLALLMLSGAAIIALFGAQTFSFGIQTTLYNTMGVSISTLQIVMLVCALAILLALTAFISRSRFGKAMRATADNEMVAEVLGINTRSVRRLTFALGSALGGVAAIFYALEFNLDPNMGVMMAIKGFTAMVIGGPGSMAGAIVGALILSGVEQASVWYLGATWRNSAAFILLFFFLLSRPQGLFGRETFH